MCKRTLLGLAVSLSLVASASATPIINVGAHYLSENSSNQKINILVTGADQVSGIQLNMQIGDGDGGDTEPVFKSISFSGGIWDTFPSSVMGGLVSGFEMYAEVGIGFNGKDDDVSAQGLIATLTIDTTGLFSGTFPLMFKTTDIGMDSYFLDPDGDPLAATIINGTITIPEPATLSLLALGGLAVLRRRNRQAKTLDQKSQGADRPDR